MSNTKLKIIYVPLTRRDRLRIWLAGIMRAVRYHPPFKRSEWLRLEEGDEGYEEAMLEEYWHRIEYPIDVRSELGKQASRAKTEKLTKMFEDHGQK